MIARFRSWWKNTSKTLKIVQIIVLLVVVVLLIGGYFFNWTWTGFGPYTPPTSNFQREKTLYDWLQLAIIPVALAFGVWWLNRLQQQRDQKLADQRAQTERETAEKQAQAERDIALDNQREAALQDYIDNMSELLLHEKLRESGQTDEVRTIAHVRTLTVLPRLDGKRKGSVVQFLYESGLIQKDKKIIDLHGAILTGAILTGAFLVGADLRYANLSGADLYEANLRGADLRETILEEANLRGADLREANLREANLRGANLDVANLRGAILEEANLDVANLRGAILREAYLSEAYLGGADLSGADLSGADLGGAKVTDGELAKAKSLEGAIMPDGTKHA